MVRCLDCDAARRALARPLPRAPGSNLSIPGSCSCFTRCPTHDIPFTTTHSRSIPLGRLLHFPVPRVLLRSASLVAPLTRSHLRRNNTPSPFHYAHASEARFDSLPTSPTCPSYPLYARRSRWTRAGATLMGLLLCSWSRTLAGHELHHVIAATTHHKATPTGSTIL